jgi:hypothetical protein
MLDPRIYRTGLFAVALAVIVFAFSLESQPSGLSTTLAPDAFNPQNAQTALSSLARSFPDRRAGSAGDAQLADSVAGSLRKLGYSVNRHTFSAATSSGPKTLVNVTGTLAGQSNDAILIVSHRDALHSPGVADLSGTAVMLELARVLGGETAYHTLVLASVSGSTSSVGAAQLAHSLPGPVDAVIVLGDLAAAHPQGPLIVPWSRGHTLASPGLRNTLAASLSAQAGLKQSPPGLGGQLMHLAFPMTLTEQAPFNDAGAPAVLLSLSGERAPSGAQATNPVMLGTLGRAVLQTVNALSSASDVPRPSGYLVYSGKLIPGWSIRLLALMLIAPVVITTVDGLARVRRRGHRVLDWVGWVLSWALAFVLGGLVVLGAHLVGALSGAPGGPVPAGVSAPHTAGIVTLVLALLVILAGLLLLAPRLARLLGVALQRPPAEAPGPAAGIAVSMILSVVGVAMWLTNPFAAVLIVPALHVWMWLGCVQAPIPRGVKLAGVVLGAVPPALAVLYYALTLKLSLIGVVWNGVLMIAGGQIGPATALLWSLVLGCFAGMLVLAVRRPNREHEPRAAITVRGPAGYAGPGSLGGTQSALRR